MIKTNSFSFEVDAAKVGEGVQLTVHGSDGTTRTYAIAGDDQEHFSDFYAELNQDFGTRLPHISAGEDEYPVSDLKWKPLLIENISPQIHVGYGDPAVLKTAQGYYLVATSNDAPDAFPILHSDDLEHWEHPASSSPKGGNRSGPRPAARWRISGRPRWRGLAMNIWVGFTARQASNALAIGLARSPTPEGPWTDSGRPLLTGKPVNTTGRSKWPAVRGSDRYATSSSTPTAIAICSGRTTATASGRALSPGCCTITPNSSTPVRKRGRIGVLQRSPRRWSAGPMGRRPMVRFFLMQPFIAAVLGNWRRVKQAIDRSLASRRRSSRP